jgi:peptidylprolyl isomerase
LVSVALGASACQRRAPAPAAVERAALAATPVASAIVPAAPADAGIDRRRPAPPDVAGPPADASATPSGLRTKVLQPGGGTHHPGQSDFVEVAYSGWRRNGLFFEGTGDGERVRFDRDEIIPGLNEGIGLMVAGEKRRFWIPLALAYAARPHHVNAPHEDMTFDVELLRIIPPPSVPADVAAPPKAASRTKSDLRYQYLHRGSGTTHPTSESWIQIRQSIWTPKGKLFYTSLRVSDVMRTPVGDLCPGVQEMIVRLVEGDRVRLWLPGKLAFGEPQPGQEPQPFSAPLGPVVIDLELVKIGD